MRGFPERPRRCIIKPGRRNVMREETRVAGVAAAELGSWIRAGIGAGLAACFVYPVMVYIEVPGILQLALGATFGPALAVASVALARVLQSRRRTVSVELAGIANALSGALVTAMIIVQLAVKTSTAPSGDEQLTAFVVRRIWDVILGLDVSFDVFIGLGTFLFGLNMLRDPRFGRIMGWIGMTIAAGMIIGANLYYFPDPPRQHGFPEIGIFTGLWYLAVVVMLIRSLRKGRQERI
jgi:hypothetical protein